MIAAIGIAKLKRINLITLFIRAINALKSQGLAILPSAPTMLSQGTRPPSNSRRTSAPGVIREGSIAAGGVVPKFGVGVIVGGVSAGCCVSAGAVSPAGVSPTLVSPPAPFESGSFAWIGENGKRITASANIQIKSVRYIA